MRRGVDAVEEKGLVDMARQLGRGDGLPLSECMRRCV